MDKGIFETNVRIIDLEIDALAKSLDVLDGASEEYTAIAKNFKMMLECQAIPANILLQIEKLEEEQRQYDRRIESEEANFDKKMAVEEEKIKRELALAERKLEEERRQAELRHQHDIDELTEERRHNLAEEALRIKAEHEKNIVTGGGILITTLLAAVIYVGEFKGGVLGSGATSILRLVKLF